MRFKNHLANNRKQPALCPYNQFWDIISGILNFKKLKKSIVAGWVIFCATQKSQSQSP